MRRIIAWVGSAILAGASIFNTKLLIHSHIGLALIADTMMKFASFETIVELIYKHSIPTPKDQCSKSLQLGVSLAGGYVAGLLCAVVSHPADNLVSFLNNIQGVTVGDAVKKMGLLGLCTRGLTLRILTVGTTGTQVFVGLQTTGRVNSAVTELAEV